jgi:hypothetical protein
VANGTTLTVTAVTETGLAVTDRHGANFALPAQFVAGSGRDGRPNLSHA